MVLLSRRARARRRNTAIVAVAVIVAAEVAARFLVPVLDPIPLEWPNATMQLQTEQIEALSGTQLAGTDIPVVFAGSSAAQQAFVPETFSALDETVRDSYNAAVPMGVPTVVNPWLLDHVADALEPSLVVWGVSITDFAPENVDRSTEAYRTSLGGADGLTGDVNRLAADASALVALRPALSDPSLLAGPRRDRTLAQVERAERTLAPAGNRTGDEIEPDAQPARWAPTLENFEVDEDATQAVDTAIEALQRRGLPVVLVALPVSPELVELLPQGAADVEAFNEALAEVARRLDVALFVPQGNYGADAFSDVIHLTDEASVSLTTELVAAMPSLERPDVESLFGVGSNLRQLIAQNVPAAIEPGLAELLTAVEAMDAACNEPVEWMQAAAAVRDQLEANQATISQADDAASIEFRAGANGNRISSGFGGRVLLQSGCEPGLVVGSAPSLEEFRTLSSELVTAFERFDASLRDPEGPVPVSPLWMRPDEVYHYEGLRADVVAGLPLELAVIGEAESRSGVDPELLSDLTGTQAVNLSMNRATPEVAELWLADLSEVSTPQHLVWVVSPAQLFTSCGLDLRQADYLSGGIAREQLFPLAWRPGGSDLDIVLGAPGAGIYDDSPTGTVANALYRPGTRGQLWIPPATPEEFDAVVDPFREPERILDCPERFNRMSDFVRAAVGSGQRITVVGAPSAEELLAMHPNGAAGILSSFQRDMEALVAAGADYVDLTSGFEREHFNLPTELNDAGRRLFTERLAEALNG